MARRALAAAIVAIMVAAPQRSNAEGTEPVATPAHLLRCAADEATAAAAVDAANSATLEPFSLPVEVTPAGPVVRAAEVDAMLLSLHNLYQQFPAQRERIEQLILSWNYCDLLHGKEVWDIGLEGGTEVRAKAPNKRGGFRGFLAWGLLPSAERTIPKLLVENSLGRGQREWFVSESVHARCFPDPVTGLTPFDDASGQSAVLGARAIPRARIESLERVEPADAPCPVLEPPPAEEAEPPKQAAAPKQPPTVPVIFANPTAGTPGVMPAPTTDAKGGVKLAGNVYYTVPIAHGSSIGVRTTLIPAENWFTRIGINQRLDQSPASVPSYSYGLGYNDWHAGTFSIELNHWGPIPIDTLDIKGAQLDFGYKAPLPEELAKFLGLGFGFTIPIRRPPSLSCGMTFKPFGDWFVMGGLRATPWNAEYTWVYGFGVWSWKPYTFSLTYNNWGLNRAFDTNFIKNGSATFAWSWVL